MKLTEKEVSERLIQNSRLDDFLDKSSRELSKSLKFLISREDVFVAIFLLYKEKEKLEVPSELWVTKLDFNEVRNGLENFDFKIIHNRILTNTIIDKDFLVNYKVRIKKKGLIWLIHKYDPDPFPSKPHAHLIDDNIKLDLSNGKLYKKGKVIDTLNKKHLLEIRKEANKNFILPKLSI
ncbi:hypothetical protein [Mesonia sp. K7]|uniref:hypothetical protein n=1 Tax=Mesonia sp. K7 TaxID=2218606 RepID=UPI0011B374BA|nr:hypothetical protein [Mesonia sp. K7]